MKKRILGVTFGAAFLLVGLISISPTEAQAVQATSCCWKVIDCPGIGTGDYEACLSNGDGNTCNCGAVTRNCPGSGNQ